MTRVGCTYLAAQILIQAHASDLFTAGIWLSDAWVVLFVLFLLAFPDGRIKARFDLFVIGMFALMAFPLELALAALLRDRREPRERAGGLAERRRRGQRRLRPAGSRRAGLRRPGRHVDAALDRCQPAAPTGARAHPRRLGRHPPGIRPRRVSTSSGSSSRRRGGRSLVAYVAIPLVVLGGILRSRLARSTVGDLFVELHADPTPGELRDALARTLRDPSLTLAYWLPAVPKLVRSRRPAGAAAGRRRRPGRDDDRPQRGAHGGPGPRSRAGRRARAARRRQRGGRNRDRERTAARRAAGAAGGAPRIAFADRRGGTEGAAAAGAQPARRRPAAADRALARAQPPRAGAGRRRLAPACAWRRRGARSRPRSESCARSRAAFTPPSSAATGSRSRSSSSRRARPCPFV